MSSAEAPVAASVGGARRSAAPRRQRNAPRKKKEHKQKQEKKEGEQTIAKRATGQRGKLQRVIELTFADENVRVVPSATAIKRSPGSTSSHPTSCSRMSACPARTATKSPTTSRAAAPRAHPGAAADQRVRADRSGRRTTPAATACWPNRSSRRCHQLVNELLARTATDRRRSRHRATAERRTATQTHRRRTERDAAVTHARWSTTSTAQRRLAKLPGARTDATRSMSPPRRSAEPPAPPHRPTTAAGAGGGVRGAARRRAERRRPPARGIAVLPAITDELVERVARRVLEKLSDRVVRETVADLVSTIAERLVRDEIERIKGDRAINSCNTII